MLVPSRKAIHVDPLSGESHPHVAVPPLAYDLHLKVVETTGGGDGVGGPHAAGVLVSLPVAFVVNPQVGLRQSNVIILVLEKILPIEFLCSLLYYTTIQFYLC